MMEWAFSVEEDKMADLFTQKAFLDLLPPSVGPISAGRGRIISGHLAYRFGSPFGTNTKLLRGVIGPMSTLNDHVLKNSIP